MELEFTFFGTDEDLGNLYLIPSELAPKNCKICGAPSVIATAGYSQAVFCSKHPDHNFTPWICSIIADYPAVSKWNEIN